jgi:hypothetical protein
MLVLLFMVLSVVQVAFALYGRNVVASSAHEGVRAAVEYGTDPQEASVVAARTVRSAAGGLVDDLAVDVTVQEAAETSIVQVRVRAVLDSFGPVPMPLPVSASATSTKESGVP